jgi:hypothetical protein
VNSVRRVAAPVCGMRAVPIQSSPLLQSDEDATESAAESRLISHPAKD